jgi:hypothetical protein
MAATNLRADLRPALSIGEAVEEASPTAEALELTLSTAESLEERRQAALCRRRALSPHRGRSVCLDACSALGSVHTLSERGAGVARKGCRAGTDFGWMHLGCSRRDHGHCRIVRRRVSTHLQFSVQSQACTKREVLCHCRLFARWSMRANEYCSPRRSRPVCTASSPSRAAPTALRNRPATRQVPP